LRPIWYLASGVHACVTEYGPVLLDERRDRFHALTQNQAVVFQSYVAGWHTLTNAACPDAGDSESLASDSHSLPAWRFLDKQVSTGLLTRDPREGRTAQPVQIPRPTRALAISNLFEPPKVTLGNIITFAHAAYRARFMLENLAFHCVLARMRRSREENNSIERDLDLGRAQALAASFSWLEPLLLGGKTLCKKRSLARILYANHYGMYPSWVFGVRTRPFHSHCWVQSGAIVWNDLPERIAPYTPIMVI
jgi:hypothetical protein